MKYNDLTEQVIKAFFKVYNALGYGFLEKVYENALFGELTRGGFSVERQSAIAVYFSKKVVGEYYADLVVNDLLIIEIKAHECLLVEHEN